MGTSVSEAGDINEDGIDDVIIGASNVDSNDIFNAGESYVVFGFVPSELTGTNGDDTLNGGIEGEIISGLGGNDSLSGNGGNDEIFGGSGNDLLSGGEGNDTLRGQRGNDSLFGGEGSDRLFGDVGNDDISGGSGNDLIQGGSEGDRILGGIGDDSISGGTGNDIISGGLGNDSLRGNFADDTIRGNLGADVLWGDFGNDELIGGKGNDLLIGGRGNDDVRGTGGSERLIGVDTININSDFGIGEIDTLTGGEGDDTYILADENRVFYDDGDNTTSGEDDLAIITTLNTNRDTIQLSGNAELYRLDFFTLGENSTDARLIYDLGVAAIGEAIAVIENVDTGLSLDNEVFTFV